jgi:hypothetical protein
MDLYTKLTAGEVKMDLDLTRTEKIVKLFVRAREKCRLPASGP